MNLEERTELHRRIMLLRDELGSGKVVFAKHLAAEFRELLEQVAIGSDGLVDPETVDPRVRATALMIAHMEFREEAKDSASVAEIQEAYFGRVDAMFGGLYSQMQEYNVDPYQMARAFASDQGQVDDNYEAFTTFVEEIKDFWDVASVPGWIHSEESKHLKLVFGGSLFPHGERNAASLYGFYSDTLILPDPFLKLVPLLSHWSKERQIYELTRLGLAVLGYRGLALAAVDPPIVVILPGKFGLEEDYRDVIWGLATKDVLMHTGRMFGRSFESVDAAQDYVRTLQSPDDVARAMERPDLLLFDTDWKEASADQIRRFLAEEGKVLPAETAGETVLMHTQSRMSQATEILDRSAGFGGTPVIEAPTSWRWLNWKLEYSSFQKKGTTEEMHMIRALQTVANSEFTWIGDIPPEALIEMRKTGALAEIRARLSEGVSELASADPANFTSTTNIVVANLRIAFAEHQEQMRQLAKSKTKFAGREVGSFVVTGAVEVAAAVAGYPLFGIGAAIASMSGMVPTAKELKQNLDALRRSEDETRSSPVGLLFRKSK